MNISNRPPTEAMTALARYAVTGPSKSPINIEHEEKEDDEKNNAAAASDVALQKQKQSEAATEWAPLFPLPEGSLEQDVFKDKANGTPTCLSEKSELDWSNSAEPLWQRQCCHVIPDPVLISQ